MCCRGVQVKELWDAVPAANSREDLSKLHRDAKAVIEMHLTHCPRARLLQAAVHLRAGAWREAMRSADAAGEAASQQSQRLALQAWWLQCESLYAQGDLEQCANRLGGGLAMLQQHEAEAADGQSGGAEEDCVEVPRSERAKHLAAQMARVLQLRKAGNHAFKAGKFADAERLYSEALAHRDVASPVFWALLYSNRAAVFEVRGRRSTAPLRPRAHLGAHSQAAGCVMHRRRARTTTADVQRSPGAHMHAMAF